MGAFVLFLGLLYLAHPKHYETIILHLLKLISHLFKRFDKALLEKDVNHLIKDYARSINKYLPASLYGIKIVWAEEEALEGYLEEGSVVIRMKYHKNRAKNIAKALVTYIPYTLPPKAKAVMEHDLALAISGAIAIRIAEHDPEVVGQIHEAIDAGFRDGSKGRGLLGKLGEIDEESLFLRILLPEVTEACMKAYPERPEDLWNEAMELTNVLHSLVKGKVERPMVRGKYINLAIVRVALPEKIVLDPELESHLWFARRCRTRVLYVLAAGLKAKLASKLTRRICAELRYKIDFEDAYKSIYKKMLTDIYCAKLSSTS